MGRIRLTALFVALALSCLSSGAALAVNPSEMLADPALEARAREISKGLRCVMCRNQSIDDSNAKIAHDMRVVLRERLAAGDTDAEARNYIVSRYGQYVLLKPPFSTTTLLLWFGPVILLALALLGFGRFFRRSAREPTEPPELDLSDKAIVDSLLKDGGA